MSDTTESTSSGSASDERKSFPRNAVVGIVDAPRDLIRVVRGLRTAGVEPEVYCSERAEQTIPAADNDDFMVQAKRLVAGVFGFEKEHAERHLEEVDAGHFVVLANSDDDERTGRIRDIFASHGGHFVNFYGQWTSQTLIP